MLLKKRELNKIILIQSQIFVESKIPETQDASQQYLKKSVLRVIVGEALSNLQIDNFSFCSWSHIIEFWGSIIVEKNRGFVSLPYSGFASQQHLKKSVLRVIVGEVLIWGSIRVFMRLFL